MSTTQSHPPDTPSESGRQLQELHKDQLEKLADELGVEAARYPTRQHLIAAIHQRQQLIAVLDRDAMLDCIRWGRRIVPSNASNEQLAREVLQIKSMRFDGVSQQGLYVLARLRGATVKETDDVPTLIRKLKKLEGFFSKLGRKHRRFLGSLVSGLIGETEVESEFHPTVDEKQDAPSSQPRSVSIKEEIEEAG